MATVEGLLEVLRDIARAVANDSAATRQHRILALPQHVEHRPRFDHVHAGVHGGICRAQRREHNRHDLQFGDTRDRGWTRAELQRRRG